MQRKNFLCRRDAKRTAAFASLAAWRALSIDEQLKDLALRPGSSAKQVKRLMALKSLGYGIAPVGHKHASVPQDQQTDEAPTRKQKAPPKSDVRAMKAFKKKLKALTTPSIER